MRDLLFRLIQPVRFRIKNKEAALNERLPLIIKAQAYSYSLRISLTPSGDTRP